MKSILLLFILIVFSLANVQMIQAQSVGIGTPVPDSSAMLEVSSTSKGLLIPGMTSAQRIAIKSPKGGLLVYDTDQFEIFEYDKGLSIWKKVNHWYRSATGNRIFSSVDSVGLSTSSPKQRLHINGGSIYVQDNRNGAVVNPHVIFDVPAVNYKEAGLQFTRSGDTLAAIDYVANPNTANYLKFSASGGGKGVDMVINSNGNTGLGYIDPLVKLHVRTSDESEVLRLEAGNPLIQFRRRSGFVTFSDVGFIQTNTDDLRIGTNSSNSNGRFVIRTGGGDRVFVDNAGNMSIGTSTVATGYKVSVGGKVMCEELKVQLRSNWPDYVFKNDYKLMSLSQLQKFIQVNQHLPNIPTAKEVESSGLSVGDMQKRMMEKIEELTLYILDLQKQINELKSR